jgi:putative ubiquitin-RnfH superfamily antitoxin RatB of RatAB toxin-antitoxin module
VSDKITVEVVFALPDKQSLKTLTLPRDAVVADAIAASGVLDGYPQAAISHLSFGVWGQVVAPENCLKNGDRIEIYRPLHIDPQDARRKLAAAGRTMGSSGSD